VELLSVDNLVFVLPLALAVVLVGLMAIGLPFGDDGLHIGHDVHIGAEVGHIGGMADGVHVPGVHGHVHATGGLNAILGFFGIGKVPFTLILVSFCMIWGGSGLAIRLLNVEWSLFSRCLVAGVAAIAGTRLMAGVVGKLLPSVETYGVPAADLVSEYAEVIHDVTAEGGTVRLVDSEGNLRDLACRSATEHAGDGPTGTAAVRHLKRGERVILTGYDAASDVYLAAGAAADSGLAAANGTGPGGGAGSLADRPN